MSLKNDIKNGILFNIMSEKSLNRAFDNLNYSSPNIFNPYYDLSSNLKSILHPFLHVMQLLRDIVRFAYGAIVLVGAAVTGHCSAAVKAAFGMINLIGAAVLEVFNIVLSIISLATRFLASICNFGYISVHTQLNGSFPNREEIGGRNEKKISASVLSYMMRTINKSIILGNDLYHETAFKMV